MEKLALLVLDAVRARAEYDSALKELAQEATGFPLLKIEVVTQIEAAAREGSTSMEDLMTLASLAQGNLH